MALSQDAFVEAWKQAGEDLSPTVVETAWRRYQQIQLPTYKTVPESSEPTLDDLRSVFEQVLNHPDVAEYLVSYKFLTIPAKSVPWIATGIYVGEDQPVSVFPTGRTWRSKLLDMYLTPQFNLWYRIGVCGDVFNSTRATRTFKCIPGQSGELYLSAQFPGTFSSRSGGRVQSNLSVYEKSEGEFQTIIMQWREGLGIRGDMNNMFERMEAICHEMGQPDPWGLLSVARARLSSDYFAHQFPLGWTFLWFLGVSEIFTQEEDNQAILPTHEEGTHEDDDGGGGQQQQQHLEPGAAITPGDDSSSLQIPTPGSEFLIQTRSQAPAPIIRCLPSQNVGILQQDLSPVHPFTPGTCVTWSWNLTALPSRLREDTTLTHDYLSLALEFENGRDLSYTWSWELPVDFGYWCPVPAFCDREYHIVIRSGTQELGKWIPERRDLWADYVRYLNAGDASKPLPTQITRVWLIAGNRWQRYKGEMLIKSIVLQDGGGGGGGDEDRVIL